MVSVLILLASSSWHYHERCCANVSWICTIQQCFYGTAEDDRQSIRGRRRFFCFL